MASPALTSSSLRRWKILVVVLVCTNFAQGIFALWLVRDVDQSYSDLVDSTLPALNDLQRLTVSVVNAQRALGTTGLLRSTPENRKASVGRAQVALRSLDEAQRQVLELPAFVEHAELKGGLRGAADDYSGSARQLIRLMEANQVTEAAQLRESALLGRFDGYLTTIQRTSEALKTSGMEASDRVSDKTSNMSKIVLGAAGWPVIAVMLLTVLVAIFLVGLMLMLRWREMHDPP